MTAFSIAHGHVEEHAKALTAGLSKLPSNFLAKVCVICKGYGEYEQTYCDGPNGRMRLTGGCDYCDGTGLVIGHKPAPESVLEQVLQAAK
jgi:DnaJ-class molecular chaperone